MSNINTALPIPENVPTSPPTISPTDVAIYVGTASSIAQVILQLTGQGAIAGLIPLATQLVMVAMKALSAAQGAPVTPEQITALLGNVPLVAPTQK